MILRTSRLRSRARAFAFALAATTLLAGCGAGGESSVSHVPLSDGVAEVGFEPPTLLLSARAIVEENLELVILVDGEPVEASRNSAGVFVASLERPASRPFMLSLIWYERIQGREDLFGDLLPLARFAPTEPYVPVAGEPLEIRIFAQQYDTNFDFDEDGRTNLAEQRANSSPFEFDAEPPVVLPLDISVELPSELTEADDELRASFGLRAIVNTQVVQLSREDDVWRGQTNVNEGSSPFVSVEFFSDSDPSLVLASLQSRVDLEGSTPSAAFRDDDELYRYPNGDGDSLTNIEELIEGEERNPRRSDDPPADPCETSQFTAGCTIDTDGDGRADSQEGESADRDGDGIPDFRESSEVDADDDGRFADADADEGDACIPSGDNDACRASQPPVDPCADSAFTSGCATDTDGDGRTDFQETETADTDGDGIPDFRESSAVDADDDGRFADRDADEGDACIPSRDNDACRATLPPPDPCADSNFAIGCTTDTDGDGRPDSEETETADTDDDGIPDFRESSLVDADGDLRFADADADEADPCVPSADNDACRATLPPPDPCDISQFATGCRSDIDNDGLFDWEEGEDTNTDGDDIPDFLESNVDDEDADGLAANADADDDDPCVPSTDNAPCRALQPPPPQLDPCVPSRFVAGCTTDTDGDGQSDFFEGEFTDSDNDGVLDFDESSEADVNGNGASAEADPCEPAIGNAACQAQTPTPGETTGGGVGDGGVTGAGAADAGAADAGAADAGGADAGTSDAGGTDAGVADAGAADAGVADAGAADAGVADAGAADAGVADAGAADAGVADAGVADAGAADAGVADAGATDAGVADMGVADAGMVDVGLADAGTVDAGLFDPSGMGGTDRI